MTRTSTSMSTTRPRATASGALRLAAAALMAAALTACSGAAGASQPPTAASSVAADTASLPPATPVATPTATPAPTDSPAESPSETSGPTAVATSIDPCQLFSSQEASQLAGATFGPGKESTTTGNARICTYGANTLNVFNVEVAVAPDVATAQAAKAAAQADASKAVSAGLKVTQLPTLADGAAILQGGGTISGETLSGSGIYVLKGTVFFSLNDVVVGRPAPSSSALQAAAQVVLARLP